MGIENEKFKIMLKEFKNSINIAETEREVHDKIFKFIFENMRSVDGFLNYLLNLKDKNLEIVNLSRFDSINSENALTGKVINDIALKLNTNLLDLTVTDGDINLNIILIIEIQSTVDYGLILRMKEYKEIVSNKWVMDIFGKDNYHDISNNVYLRHRKEIPIVVPVIINLDKYYQNLGEGVKLSEGLIEHDYYRDYCNYDERIKYLDIYYMNNFKWLHVDIFDIELDNIGESLLSEFIVLYKKLYKKQITKNELKEEVISMLNENKLEKFQVMIREIYADQDKRMEEVYQTYKEYMRIKEEKRELNEEYSRVKEEMKRKDKEVKEKEKEVKEKEKEVKEKDKRIRELEDCIKEAKDIAKIDIIMEMYKNNKFDKEDIAKILNEEVEFIKEIISIYEKENESQKVINQRGRDMDDKVNWE